MAIKNKKTSKKTSKKRVNASTRCPLLKAGIAVKCTDGWIAVNATTQQMFTVLQKHIDEGVPNDPRRCVVALAMMAGLGDQYEYEVGASITKIIDPVNRVFARYATPSAISEQIDRWERKGGVAYGTWDMLPGVQVLGALPASWHRMYGPKAAGDKKTGLTRNKSSKSRTTTLGGHRVKHRASPTRIVGRVAPRQG